MENKTPDGANFRKSGSIERNFASFTQSGNAQEKYAKQDKNAAIVRSTRYYKYSDPWHYDSNGYIDLGEKFAEALFLLNKR